MSTNKAKSRIQPPLSIEGEMNVPWLTTAQVAARLGVSMRTVAKWIDTGVLRGMRIPFSKDRRVHPQALVEFEKLHGFDRARGKP
jgi:excisionase family DNA binding protein